MNTRTEMYTGTGPDDGEEVTGKMGEASANMREANTKQAHLPEHKPHPITLERWCVWKEQGCTMEKDNPRRVNVYVCDDGHETFSLDMDKGTTPSFIPCQMPGCKHDAASSMYLIPDASEMIRMHEPYMFQWMRPKVFDVPRRDYMHWRSGGLLFHYGTKLGSKLVWPGPVMNRSDRREKERGEVKKEGLFRKRLSGSKGKHRNK